MAKAKQQPEDELPQDQNTDAQDTAAAAAAAEAAAAEAAAALPPADPGIAKIEDAIWKGAIHALHGTSDELHAIQMRLAEMKPYMAGAIDKAKGQTKSFLQSLADAL